jgi:hypothetical protein
MHLIDDRTNLVVYSAVEIMKLRSIDRPDLLDLIIPGKNTEIADQSLVSAISIPC